MAHSAGRYRDNPQEVMEECEYCGGLFHHSGYPMHVKYCGTKPIGDRSAWAEKRRTRFTKLKGRQLIPAKVYAAPIIQTGSEEPRVHFIISVDKDRLKDMLKSIKLGMNGKP